MLPTALQHEKQLKSRTIGIRSSTYLVSPSILSSSNEVYEYYALEGQDGQGAPDKRAYMIEVCAEWWENVSGGFLQTPNQSLSQTWGLCLVPQYPAI